MRSKEDKHKIISCNSWSENKQGERTRGLFLNLQLETPEPGRRRSENSKRVNFELDVKRIVWGK